MSEVFIYYQLIFDVIFVERVQFKKVKLSIFDIFVQPFETSLLSHNSQPIDLCKSPRNSRSARGYTNANFIVHQLFAINLLAISSTNFIWKHKSN